MPKTLNFQPGHTERECQIGYGKFADSTNTRYISKTAKIDASLLRHYSEENFALRTHEWWPLLLRQVSINQSVKSFTYSIPSVGPGADPGVQAVSPQVTVSHPSSGRLPLLSARPAVTSPAAAHHRRLAGTKLYCLVTEAHRCKQLA